MHWLTIYTAANAVEAQYIATCLNRQFDMPVNSDGRYRSAGVDVQIQWAKRKFPEYALERQTLIIAGILLTRVQ